MRRLKLQMQISLDGFVAGPGHEMDWMTWNWDEELNNYVTQITAPVDQILLGRNLAAGFIPAWDGTLAKSENDASAQKMVNTPKLVFSKTLESSTWNNTTLVKGDLAEEVTKLKQLPGGDLIAYGGATFSTSLIINNLIDDYHLFLNPVAIGKGLSIFQMLQQYLKLKLIESKAFSCGVVALHYQPVI